MIDSRQVRALVYERLRQPLSSRIAQLNSLEDLTAKAQQMGLLEPTALQVNLEN
jgi:hypothetical protein